MRISLTHVDAFTDRPFSGNPAAVCLLPEQRDDFWMQNVACEMNLSETAFLVKQESGFDLRWFTPVTEVDLCGHATLAGAHVLWEQGVIQTDEAASFNSRSGVLTARQQGDWIELDFPIIRETEADPPDGLLRGLGIAPSYVGVTRFDYLAVFDSDEIVRNLQPDMQWLRRLGDLSVIVTSRSSDSRFDFISRCFAPNQGIDEDPVTGSAHCCLGPFWKAQLNKTEMVGYQASQRGGVVRVKVAGERVQLQGQAITIFNGELIC